MSAFLKESFAVVSRRFSFLVVLNWLFFSVMVAGVLLREAGVVLVYTWPFGDIFPAETDNALVVFGVIFLFNLVLSGFVLVTLTGLAFFGLPLFLLCFRAFWWGVLLNGLSTPAFLFALPTLVLEGEGYVFAALAGVNLGLSWLKPEWTYEGKVLSRSGAVKQAFRDCVHIYFFVALLLLAAAVVETVTLVFI